MNDLKKLNYYNMENAIHEIAQGNLFWLLIFTIAGYIILRLLHKYLPLAMRKERAKKITRVSLPVAEMFFWVWVMYEAIPALYNRNQLLGILVFVAALAMIIWFAWYRLRDFIAGVIIQTGSEIKEGETVEIRETTGKVKRFRSRHLELSTSQDETVLLPYSTIISHKIIKRPSTEKTKSFTFNIEVQQDADPHAQTGLMKQFILRQPWSSLNKDPQVQFLRSEGGKNHYSITVFTPDNTHAEKIREGLVERYR